MATSAGIVVRYRAIHEYSPDGDDEDVRGYVALQPGDMLEANDPAASSDFVGTLQEPNCWLNGVNTRTGQQGLFPSTYVTFVEVVQLPSTPARPAAPTPKASLRGKPKSQSSVGASHSLVNAYFIQPALCRSCKDYIWSSEKPGLRCEVCRQCFHPSCPHSTAVCPLKPDTSAAARAIAFTATPQLVQQWSSKSVLEWMAAARLEPYIDIFRSRDVTGEDLAALSVDRLRELGVSDFNHQMAILLAVDELLDRKMAEVKYKNELPAPHHHLPSNEGQQFKDHRFIARSFVSSERCQICDKFLLGMSRQALRCDACELTCHRQCALSGLPACAPPGDLTTSQAAAVLDGADASLGGWPVSEVAVIAEVCTAHLETCNMPVLNLYKDSRETADLHALLHELTHDARQVDLTQYSASVVACALKVCLMDGRQSVLPETMYDRFIDAAGQGEQAVLALVDELPPPHSGLLRTIMTHLCRACVQRGADRGAFDDAAQLFACVLLRPPWDRVVEVAASSREVLRVFDILLRRGNWGVNLVIGPPVAAKGAPPQLPARKPSSGSSSGRPVAVPTTPTRAAVLTKQASSSSVSDASAGSSGVARPAGAPAEKQPLMAYDWYWSRITREEANELMKDAPDGSFLVRDATTGGDNYCTLTLRMGGVNKLIKIYHQNGRYGFVNEKTFESVGELVEFYTRHTLADYNRNLNVCLSNPVCKTQDDLMNQGNDEETVKAELGRLNREYLLKTQQYDSIFEEQQQIAQQIQTKQQALEAFKATVIVFEDQLKLHATFHSQALPHEQNKLQENYELLDSRLRDIRDSKNKLEDDVKVQTSKLRELAANMNLLKPDIKQLHRMREMYKTWLLDHNMPADEVEELLEKEAKQRESANLSTIEEEDPSLLAHLDESRWLMVGWERPQAERSLSNKPPGTFLLRPRSDAFAPYALSMVASKGIGHALVLRNESGMFGFSEPYCMFASLRDLVHYYRTHSLAVHNEELDVTLKYPVLPPSADGNNVYVLH